MASGVRVSLLRAVNLGSNNKIAMPWLRGVYESLGCQDVQTYLQSGNVVYRRDKAPGAVAGEVEAAIAAELGHTVPIVTRTAADLAAVTARDRYPGANPSRVVVVFLSAVLADPGKVTARLDATRTGREEFEVRDREIFQNYPDGQGRSKMATALGRRELGDVVATARNWRTVLALVEMTGTGHRS